MSSFSLTFFLQQTGHAYESMDKDTVRNKFFDAGVKTHTKDGLHKWLEIGPGAHGTLTKMVLRAHEKCTIVAIEAVEESCKQVRKLLMQDRRR